MTLSKGHQKGCQRQTHQVDCGACSSRVCDTLNLSVGPHAQPCVPTLPYFGPTLLLHSLCLHGCSSSLALPAAALRLPLWTATRHCPQLMLSPFTWDVAVPEPSACSVPCSVLLGRRLLLEDVKNTQDTVICFPARHFFLIREKEIVGRYGTDYSVMSCACTNT